MGCRWGLLVVLLVFSLLSVPVLAPVPQVISIQGRLTNSSGGLQCGAWNMTFEIYDAASGGTRQFLEYRDNVTDEVPNDCHGAYITVPSGPPCEGIFNARLGETTGCPVNATAFDTANAYLQLNINGSALSPRHRITSTGYTFRANVSEVVLGSATSGTVLNNLNPAADNTYTLGTAALRWLAGFFSNLTVSGNVSLSGANAGIVFPDSTFQTTAYAPSASIVQNLTSAPGVKMNITNSTYLDGAASVFVSGKYAYVTSYLNNALTVIDVSVPNSPAIVGSVGGLSGIRNVKVAGKYAYAILSGNLAVIDVSNPSRPVVTAASTNDPNSYLSQDQKLYVSGKYAYVGCEGGGSSNALTIVDISNPAYPTVIGYVTNDTTLEASGVYVSGKYAYIAASSVARVTVVNVTDPRSPSVVGSVYDATNLHWARDIYVSGRYAYVATGDNRTTVVDISNVSNPIVVGSIRNDTMFSNPVSISVAGKYAYVGSDTIGASLSGGVTVVDISNPTSPTVVGFNNETRVSAVSGLFVSGKYLYTVSYWRDAFDVLEIAPNIDVQAAELGSARASTLTVTDNAIVENNLYVQSGLNVGPGGLYVDGGKGISTDGNISVKGTGTGYVFADGTFQSTAATGTGSGTPSGWNTDLAGNVYLNISTDKVGIGTTGPGQKLEVYNGDILVNNQNTRGSIEIKGVGDTWNYANLKLSDSASGKAWQIDHRKDRPSQYELEYYDGSGWSTRFVVNGTTGRVGIGTTSPSNTLDVVGTAKISQNLTVGSTVPSDVNSGNPIIIAKVNSTNFSLAIGTLQALDVYDSKFLITGKVPGFPAVNIQHWDISNPASPVPLQPNINLGSRPIDKIVTAGGYAYMGIDNSTNQGSFCTMELSNMSDTNGGFPRYACLDTSGYGIYDIALSGHYAYAGGQTSMVIDIADPLAPVWITSAGGFGLGPSGLFTKDNYVYVANTGTILFGGSGSFGVYDITNPANPTFVGGGGSQLQKCLSVYVVDQYAYLGCDNSTTSQGNFFIMNLTNQTGGKWAITTQSKMWWKADNATSVRVAGKYAYLATASSTDGYYFRMIDISDANNPYEVANVSLWGPIRDIKIVGKYAYLAIQTTIANTQGQLAVLELPGIESPSASIGNLESGTLRVSESAEIGKHLVVDSGLNVGRAGIKSNGPITVKVEHIYDGIAAISSTTSPRIAAQIPSTGDNGFSASLMAQNNGTNGRGALYIEGSHSGFDGSQVGDGPAQIRMTGDNLAPNPLTFATVVQAGAGIMKLDIVNDQSGRSYNGLMTWANTNRVGINNTAPVAKLTVGTLTGTGNPTYPGTIQIQANGAQGGSANVWIGGGGVEFKAATSGSGYGWDIAAVDPGGGETPLVFSFRSSNAAWTNFMKFQPSTTRMHVVGSGNFTSLLFVNNGQNTVYRCATWGAGREAVGVLTTNSTACQTTTDTGLRVS